MVIFLQRYIGRPFDIILRCIHFQLLPQIFPRIFDALHQVFLFLYRFLPDDVTVLAMCWIIEVLEGGVGELSVADHGGVFNSATARVTVPQTLGSALARQNLAIWW